MVDYLEQSLERTEALLEEVRRLERGLSALTAAPGGEAPPSGGEEDSEQKEAGREDGAETGRAVADPVLEGIPSPLPSYAGERSDAASEEEGENQAGGLKKSETPALLRQMKRLERAEAVPAGEAFRRWRAGAETSGGYPVSLPGSRAASLPGAAVGAGSGQNAVLSGAPSADEVRWVERADRVFRRDSRRYDGGFYLY